MNTPHRTTEEFSRALLAATLSGRRASDFLVDADLRKYVVTDIKAPSVGILARLVSLIAPRTVRVDVTFAEPTAMTLEQAKNAVQSALQSSKSVETYWEEGRKPLQARLQQIESATSFMTLWKTLK